MACEYMGCLFANMHGLPRLSSLLKQIVQMRRTGHITSKIVRQILLVCLCLLPCSCKHKTPPAPEDYFSAEFGMKAPADVKNLRSGTVEVGDAFVIWLAFSCNDSS